MEHISNAISNNLINCILIRHDGAFFFFFLYTKAMLLEDGKELRNSLVFNMVGLFPTRLLWQANGKTRQSHQDATLQKATLCFQALDSSTLT